ncbi:hypothetical protein B9Z55_022618 [Caenorhabditis nigoni]|uniref:Uncharacterized protein n=1 Tax=Caenorhabditis nigoni TaxID=1611254 RepID=A0A2G5SLH2_9PELO|nr:hypothetical protein B9Z55_022618 [Caenorhabditis nigoni]
MKPTIVVDENLELSDVEEELEDEEDLESDDSESLVADDELSVTTKSPTPSPLGSPAGPSSPCGSQEPNEFSMPKTPVNDGLPMADGALFSAESPEHSSMVPKRRRIESLKSTETASSANKQNGRSAGCSSSNGSSVPDELAKPMGTPVKVGLPIPKRSPKCGPIVPKRRRIESPSSTEAISLKKSQIGQSQPTDVAPPNEFSIPDGFVKSRGTPLEVVRPISSGSPESGCIDRVGTGTTSFPAGYTESSELPMTLTSDMHEFVARWTEARLRLAHVYLYMGFPFPAGVSFATIFSEITTNLYQAALLSGLFATVGSNKPNGNRVSLETEKPTEDSIPERLGEVGSKEQNEDSGSTGLPIRATCILLTDELREELLQLNTYAAQIESNGEGTPEQINGLANAVESPITVEILSPAASSDQNGLPMALRSPTRTETSLPTESLEEATLASPIQSSVPNGSEQVKGLAIIIEPPDTVGNGSPAASSKQNGLLMVVESPVTFGNTPLAASSIPDKLKNIGLQILFLLSSGSENQTGYPISVGSQIQSMPDLVADAARWAEARSRVAQVYSLMGFPIPAGIPFETRFADIQSHLYQAALLSGCFDQVGSNEPNGTLVALEPPNPVPGPSLPAGSREELAKAESAEPNEIPTVAGSAFSSVRTFSNALFGCWKKVQSCLVQFFSMLVFLPYASPPSASSLPAEAVSAPLPKPQPPENGPESIDMEVGEDDY